MNIFGNLIKVLFLFFTDVNTILSFGYDYFTEMSETDLLIVKFLKFMACNIGKSITVLVNLWKEKKTRMNI